MNNTQPNSLHQAVCLNNPDLLKRLLAQGVSINAQDIRGMTALHIAAIEGHEAIVDFLLLCGADPYLKDFQGQTAMIYAVKKGHANVVQLLAACKPMENIHSGVSKNDAVSSNSTRQQKLNPPAAVSNTPSPNSTSFFDTTEGHLLQTAGLIVVMLIAVYIIILMTGNTPFARRLLVGIAIFIFIPLVRSIWGYDSGF